MGPKTSVAADVSRNRFQLGRNRFGCGHTFILMQHFHGRGDAAAMRRRDRFGRVIAICGRLVRWSPALWVSAPRPHRDRLLRLVVVLAVFQRLAAAIATAAEFVAAVASHAGLTQEGRKRHKVHSVMDTIVHRGEKATLLLVLVASWPSYTRRVQNTQEFEFSKRFSQDFERRLCNG